MPINLVVADDHPIILSGLENLFRLEPDLNVVASCSDGMEAVRAVLTYRPDVLVLDLHMPRLDGLGVLKRLDAAHSPTRCVLLAVSIESHELREAVRLGVRGAMLKETAPQAIVQCVREIHAGRRWMDSGVETQVREQEAATRRITELLTPREVEVARAVASGLRNKEIAERLSIAEGTVKIHLHTVYEKLGVDGRTALAIHLKEIGFR
jgi:two-component system nitrate/nitrite response regulator NarL